jgi:rubrerythrin
MSLIRKPVSNAGRRRFLVTAVTLPLAAPGFAIRAVGAKGDSPYTATVAALRKGVIAETTAHERYVQFGRSAKTDGYRGLAYLYTALATSELIHARNYNNLLASLGEPRVKPVVEPAPEGTAKENVIFAAKREMASIESTYPRLLERIRKEGHTKAIAEVEYSWASHKQHLDIINKILRWSPGFFERVAKTIDEKTERYYVCDLCGSTVTKVPDGGCIICGEPPSNYRLIPTDRYF